MLVVSFFWAHGLYANDNENYEELEAVEVYGIYEVYNCIVDSTYVVGTGKSSDARGGQLLITITNDVVDIKSSREDLPYESLNLIVKSEVEIVAINKSMQFTYQVMANKFSFMTGNGKSKFRSGTGHLGSQMLTYGSCNKN